MQRLGHSRCAAQAGDRRAFVASATAQQRPPKLAAMRLVPGSLLATRAGLNTEMAVQSLRMLAR
jgi:hypothetical protein